jgi:hypothetical protein
MELMQLTLSASYCLRMKELRVLWIRCLLRRGCLDCSVSGQARLE